MSANARKPVKNSASKQTFQQYERDTEDAWDDGDDDLLVRLRLDTNFIQSTANQVISNHNSTPAATHKTTGTCELTTGICELTTAKCELVTAACKLTTATCELTTATCEHIYMYIIFVLYEVQRGSLSVIDCKMGLSDKQSASANISIYIHKHYYIQRLSRPVMRCIYICI